jgi:tetratricopeptide (TPR) repeat protein
MPQNKSSIFYRVLKYNPDYIWAWYHKAQIYGSQKNLLLAVENLRQAINFNSEYKETARTDKDFDLIRGDPKFKELVQS